MVEKINTNAMPKAGSYIDITSLIPRVVNRPAMQLIHWIPIVSRHLLNSKILIFPA